MIFSHEGFAAGAHCQDVGNKRRRLRRALLWTVTTLALTLLGGTARAASSQGAPGQNSAAQVFAEADEVSELIETVRDGAALSPVAEMTSGGGVKWFMVKTRNGNVGWIKAGDNLAAKKIDDHFRALPKESFVFAPSDADDSAAKTSATEVITIPVKINGPKVSVPVTFVVGNSSVTGNLAVDTGASQTLISKRMAQELRMYASGSGERAGIGGVVTVNTGKVDSIRVGEAEAKNLQVSIHDFSKDPSVEGLLGYDFLGRYNMSVDSDKQVMVLTPRAKSTPDNAQAGAGNSP
jgi:hypothetical protein